MVSVYLKHEKVLKVLIVLFALWGFGSAGVMQHNDTSNILAHVAAIFMGIPFVLITCLILLIITFTFESLIFNFDQDYDFKKTGKIRTFSFVMILFYICSMSTMLTFVINLADISYLNTLAIPVALAYSIATVLITRYMFRIIQKFVLF